jgi:hypothetical protein
MSDTVNKEYAFLPSKCLDPLLEKFMPAKQSVAFKRSMKAAQDEREMIDNIVEVR